VRIEGWMCGSDVQRRQALQDMDGWLCELCFGYVNVL
jgi:hypothetical protein